MTSRDDEIDWLEAAVLYWFRPSSVDEDAFNQLLEALGEDINQLELSQLKISVGIASLKIDRIRPTKREIIEKCDISAKTALRLILAAGAMREVLAFSFRYLDPGNQKQLTHTLPDFMKGLENFASIVVGLQENLGNSLPDRFPKGNVTELVHELTSVWLGRNLPVKTTAGGRFDEYLTAGYRAAFKKDIKSSSGLLMLAKKFADEVAKSPPPGIKK